eukprot:192778-Hanusia_phi.AAC.1
MPAQVMKAVASAAVMGAVGFAAVAMNKFKDTPLEREEGRCRSSGVATGQEVPAGAQHEPETRAAGGEETAAGQGSEQGVASPSLAFVSTKLPQLYW